MDSSEPPGQVDDPACLESSRPVGYRAAITCTTGESGSTRRRRGNSPRKLSGTRTVAQDDSGEQPPTWLADGASPGNRVNLSGPGYGWVPTDATNR